MQGKRPVVRWMLGCVLGATLVGALVHFRAGAVGTRAQGGTSAGREPRATPVLVASVVQRDLPIDLEGIGSAVPIQTVTVRSQVDGRIEKLFFREGQSVRRGDLLAQIDPRPFANMLQQAEGAHARDRATLESARANLERLEKLASARFVSTQEVQNQQALVAQTEAALQVDQAQIGAAQLNLDYARIRSPIDGVTGIRLIDPGNFVRAGDAGGIVIITQLDPIAVVFTLPQDDLPKVSEQLARGVELGVDAYDREGVTKLGSGRLTVIDNQVISATATIRLKAVLPNPERKLWPNLFVKARLHLEARRDALVVPTPAVQRGPRGPFVYVVKSDQTVEARPVEVELTVADTVLVRAGLAVGEQVVVEGQAQLRPGSRVDVRPAPGAEHSEREGRP